MIITNKYNLPEHYYQACLVNNYPRFDWDTFSVTELNKGIKEIILTRRHWETLEQDCSDMLWLVFGTAVHEVLGGHDGDNELSEQRMYLDINCGEYGVKTLSGSFDLYNGSTGYITDNKSTGVFSYQMKLKEFDSSDWAKQLWLYALMLGKLGFEVKGLKNLVLLKDWSKTKMRREVGYPEVPVVEIDYGFTPIRSDVAAQMEADISEKIQMILKYKDSPESEIPDCTKSQRWERGEKWALMKEGGKRAVKLFDSAFEANTALSANGAKYYIDHRLGVNVKCEDYCTACVECSFYKNHVLGDMPVKGESDEAGF